MEALVAIGLTANILQFVEVAGRLIASTRELSLRGAKSEYIELESIAQQLRSLAESIRPPESDGVGEGQEHPYPDAGLGKLAKDCIDIADELLESSTPSKHRGGRKDGKPSTKL